MKGQRILVSTAILFVGYTAATAENVYWQFDETGNALDALGSVDLTRNAGNRVAAIAPNPVPNPDAGPFDTGTPAENPYAIDDPRYYINTTTRFHLTTTASWTFETYFTCDSNPHKRHVSPTRWEGSFRQLHRLDAFRYL
jgi:hypothetical protein